jgi:hypothetical protein
MYWTQANALLGSAKIPKHITQNMVTSIGSAGLSKTRLVYSQSAPWGTAPSAHKSTRIQKNTASLPKTAVHPVRCQHGITSS